MEVTAMKKYNNITIPEATKINVGTLYEGWQGGNAHAWKTEKELKEMILNDLKKAGIKATLRFNRGGWTTSLTVTIKLTKDAIKNFVEWYNDGYHLDLYGWNYYTTENGKIDGIHGEYIDTNDTELLDNIAHTQYKMTVDYITNNSLHKTNFDILTAPANYTLETVQAILDSYNSDESNAQIDYFNRGFYDHICIKFV